jgi:hypothetical protein
MKISLLIGLLVGASFAAYGQSASPRMVSVDPANGKVGDVIAVTGENLGKAQIAKVYLTDGGDGKGDLEVQISEQTDTTLKFKIPAKATGRMALLILTATKPAQLIEQPVKVAIDDGTAQ